MSLRHALLGLLAHQSASGYDLMALFRTSLSHVWPATQSQVYLELNKLADAGLIEAEATGPRGRKEYRITDAGRSELVGWVLDPAALPPQRSALLLQVFFFGVLPAEQAAVYLEDRARVAAGRLEALTRVAATQDWTLGPLAVNGRLALEYGLRHAAMERDWAQWAARQLTARDDSA